MYFPEGTYRLTKPEQGGHLISLPSNVRLVSQENAKLLDTGHSSGLLDEWKTGPMIRMNGSKDIAIKGIRFEGPGQALHMRNVERITIQDCFFKSHTPMAIFGDNTYEIKVSQCIFEDVGYGLYIRSPIKWQILNNRFLGCGRALEAQGATNCLVSGNFIDGMAKDGNIKGVVGLLFFPNSQASNTGFLSKMKTIAQKASNMMIPLKSYGGGASTVGNIIANNEVHNVREEGISLDCRGNAPKYYYGLPGMVATADSTSFTDAFHNASELSIAPSCYVVVLDGRGAGQYRLVTSVRGKTLSVSPAWDTIPDKTSRYNLLRAAVNNRINGNKVVNAQLGSIMLWGACLDNEVIDNIVLRSPSTGIQCSSLRPDVYKGMSRVLACFDNRIHGNQVSGSERTKKPARSGIELSNRYGGEKEVLNYRNTVIGNRIDNFEAGIGVSVQKNAVIKDNIFTNCNVKIRQGDHLVNCTIQK